MNGDILAEKMAAEQSMMKSGKATNPSTPQHGDDVTRGVGALVIKNGQILTGLRAKENVYGGPGGHIEDGETPDVERQRK